MLSLPYPCIKHFVLLWLFRAVAFIWGEWESCVWDSALQCVPVCNRKEWGHCGVPSEWWHRGIPHGGALLCPTQHRRGGFRPCGGKCACLCVRHYLTVTNRWHSLQSNNHNMPIKQELSIFRWPKIWSSLCVTSVLKLCYTFSC